MNGLPDYPPEWDDPDAPEYDDPDAPDDPDEPDDDDYDPQWGCERLTDYEIRLNGGR